MRAPSPSAWDTFAAPPLGVILHASRSGRPRTVEQEFHGTVTWAMGGAGGLAWHATIGEFRYAVHLPATAWSWHARSFSRRWLGIEFSQANLGEPISDGQLIAAASYLVAEVQPAWPALDLLRPGRLLEHWQADKLLGSIDGKTDVAPAAPGALAARLRAALREVGSAGGASD